MTKKSRAVSQIKGMTHLTPFSTTLHRYYQTSCHSPQSLEQNTMLRRATGLLWAHASQKHIAAHITRVQKHLLSTECYQCPPLAHDSCMPVLEPVPAANRTEGKLALGKRHENHNPTKKERKEQLQRCEGYDSLKSWHPIRKRCSFFTINLRW